MKNFIFFLPVAALLMMAALTSCEDKEKSTPSEVQRDAVVTALSKYNELSEFNALLQKMYVSDIQADEFTVFAIKNEGMGKSSINEGINLRRHIVTRKYSKSSLTNEQLLTALDGTVLKIIIMGERVYVNGVELGEEIPAGNSVAYIVEKPITSAFNTVQYSFTVYECNAAWSPSNNIPYLAAPGATVSLYDRDNSEYTLGTYITDTAGKLTITLVNGSYAYKVTKGNASNISKDGFLIVGIFTEIGGWHPVQPSAVLGGLKYADLNGDGIINNDDKPWGGLIWLPSSQDVYIAAADFAPTYKP